MPHGLGEIDGARDLIDLQMIRSTQGERIDLEMSLDAGNEATHQWLLLLNTTLVRVAAGDVWKDCNMRNIFAAAGGISLLFIAMLSASADTGLGRHKKMYAVPAPGKVVIDGKLDDWDLSGQIMTYVVSETSDMQSAKFAVMYDKTNLYLSAVVRDTTPMMNRHDPKAEGANGWDADACQFRMSIDPTKPYPPIAAVYDPVTAEDPSYVHMTMWYYTDGNEPVLQMADSMRYKLPRKEWGPYGIVPHENYQAKYVKSSDGRGYTFEYAIPWSTLGASAPLKGGDLVAGTVQFDYGSPSGLHTAGGSAWCYDLMAGPGFPYQNTSCWGKLIFSAKGKLPKQMVEQGVIPEKPLPLKIWLRSARRRPDYYSIGR